MPSTILGPLVGEGAYHGSPHRVTLGRAREGESAGKLIQSRHNRTVETVQSFTTALSETGIGGPSQPRQSTSGPIGRSRASHVPQLMRRPGGGGLGRFVATGWGRLYAPPCQIEAWWSWGRMQKVRRGGLPGGWHALFAAPRSCLQKARPDRGQAQYAPGHRQLTPGHRQLTPGQRRLTPGHRQLTPGRRPPTPGRRRLTPGHRQLILGSRQSR